MFPIHDYTERIHGRPYVNYSLIAINAIVFVWEIIVTGFFTNAQAKEAIFYTYGVIPKFLLAGYLPSVLTSMFIHGSLAQLWETWYFCSYLETTLKIDLDALNIS